MSKFWFNLLGIILIAESINSFLGFRTLIRGKGHTHTSIEFAIFMGLTGIVILFITYIYFKGKKLINYSKCPKCKISYRYETLKDGICPTCNIKTIETEEYYKKYPEELDDI
jgi:ssDNA-binding Zn-finger/Zn-ribbon topoisomerase 1